MGLSLHVARANFGLGAEALAPGLQLAASVRSVEDHGFILSLGIKVAPWLWDCGPSFCGSDTEHRVLTYCLPAALYPRLGHKGRGQRRRRCHDDLNA